MWMIPSRWRVWRIREAELGPKLIDHLATKDTERADALTDTENVASQRARVGFKEKGD